MKIAFRLLLMILMVIMLEIRVIIVLPSQIPVRKMLMGIILEMSVITVPMI